MKRVIGLSLILLLGLLAACAPIAPLTPAPTVTPSAALLDQPFTLHVGQSLALDADGLTVRFDDVSEDSRCPTQVACVWSGRASLGVTIKKSGQPALAHTLSTKSSPAPTERLFYLDYTLTLKNLTPRPEQPGSSVPLDQYEATFVVAKRPITADCPPRPDDAAGYLETICQYVIAKHLNIAPAEPTTYTIKRIEERTQNNRNVVWVFLNCCGLGDIAVIDLVTGEIIEFRIGAQ